jgi:inosose dehydratase
MEALIGCSGITWRKRGLGDGLRDIAAAGYEGAPISGVESRDAAEIGRLWNTHALSPAPGYLNGEFWDPAQRDDHLHNARTHAKVSRELDLKDIFIAVGGFETATRAGRTRRQAAANAGPLDALTDQQFRYMTQTITEVCEVFLEAGVRPCFHTHVGTFVETEDEIESLLAAIDPELLFVGPDTGHLAWAGIDVDDFFRRHAQRITSVHLKDLDLEVRDRGRAAGWGYADFEKRGIWTEIGSGDIDFPGLFKILNDVSYSGWLTVETDVTQQPTPADSARISREYLAGLGL